MSIGRDIFSNKHWETITTGQVVGTRVIKADIPNDIPIPPELLARLRARLFAYHEFPKGEVAFYQVRIACLEHVLEYANKYVEIRGDKFVKDNPAISPKPGRPAPYLSELQTLGSVDYWVYKLKEQCLQKIKELRVFIEYYKNNDTLDRDQETLKNAIYTKGSHEDEDGVNPQPGVILEIINPLHWQFEINPRRDTFDEVTGKCYPSHHNLYFLLNRLFYEWLNSDSSQPFFAFVEGHPSSGEYAIFAEKRVEEMNAIDYSGVDTLVANIRIDPQSRQIVLWDNDQNAPITTKNLTKGYMKKGSIPGMVALVWDENGQLKAAPHKQGLYHHTSITQGRKAKAVGMLASTNGIITHINNNSGHYYPSSFNLYIFVRFLCEKMLEGLDSSKAHKEITETLEETSFLVGDFNNNRDDVSVYVSLLEYLFWAEALPDVKRYLNKKGKTLYTHHLQAAEGYNFSAANSIGKKVLECLGRAPDVSQTNLQAISPHTFLKTNSIFSLASTSKNHQSLIMSTEELFQQAARLRTEEMKKNPPDFNKYLLLLREIYNRLLPEKMPLFSNEEKIFTRNIVDSAVKYINENALELNPELIQFWNDRVEWISDNRDKLTLDMKKRQEITNFEAKVKTYRQMMGLEVPPVSSSASRLLDSVEYSPKKPKGQPRHPLSLSVGVLQESPLNNSSSSAQDALSSSDTAVQDRRSVTRKLLFSMYMDPPPPLTKAETEVVEQDHHLLGLVKNAESITGSPVIPRMKAKDNTRSPPTVSRNNLG